MKLYIINDKGDLIKLKKLNFVKNDVYLIDDEKTIYVWFGLNIPHNRKDTTLNLARSLIRQRGETVKLLVMDQNQEYGAFLAMMKNLKEGRGLDDIVERRPELELEKYSKNVLSEKEKKESLKSQIKVAAYFISQKNLPYDILCWLLAELQLNVQKGHGNFSEDEIKRKAGEIYESSSTYDELCWLIAELNILIEKKYFDMN
ncbi:MAG: hypothetical protein ACTSRI_17760 [Promethearchaeota archaeon]